MTLNTDHFLTHLNAFEFRDLFVDVLGWSYPVGHRPETFEVDGERYRREEVADLARVKVFKVTSDDGEIPDRQAREAIRREISKQYHENLLIFADEQQTRTLWHWGKRDNGRVTAREHLYVRGQPGDLFLSKISSLFVDISELDERGEVSIVDVARRLRDALDVERVTKTFYEEYKAERERFIELIDGIEDERDRAWYASVMLNRLMFVYFLQRKGFIDRHNLNYLRGQLANVRQHGDDRYYEEFLKPLFFEGLAKPEKGRDPAVARLIGVVPHLGGSIFLPHQIEERWPGIAIPDGAFESIFALFRRWSWNLDDTPDGNPSTINPDVLGYIFEKYINQKAFGAYYTPPEITEYLCEQTINRLILERVNTPAIPGIAPAREFESVQELLMKLDSRLCRELLFEILPKLTLLDPACGSGAFLIAALKTLVDVYAAVVGRIEFVGDPDLRRWLRETREAHHGSVDHYIRKKIIAENLYGVDIMPEAAEMAKLRLYLALVSSVSHVDQLEPLPNIDFNLLTGNSLIGLLRVDEDAYNQRHRQMGLFSKPYSELVKEKNRRIANYREATDYADDLREMRDGIDEFRQEANQQLNQMLLDQWNRELGIKFEEASWDLKRNKAGKTTKRNLRIEDIEMLRPFHWGFEFDQVMNERGGFDAIITNPPWEIVKPNAKEFLQQFSDDITINKMSIKGLQKAQAELLQDPEIMEDWLAYQSSFPHQSAFYRSAPQYINQISIVNGRKQGTDINLYKLFTEQCFNLLRKGGECGIVIPSGIYTDLGAMQLRKMLFEQTQITGMFGFENRKAIFEGVHRSYKFIVLTFERGGQTDQFPAAFMRHDVEDLKDFPARIGLEVSVALIERLSPDSLSVMEFKNDQDVQIAEKMLHFPLLGERLDDTWNLELTREFDMTNDSDLFETEPGPGRLPLYEGKMIHQFTHQWGEPRYWIDEQVGRARVLRQEQDHGQPLAYQGHRLGFRDVARNTDERTMICGVSPKQIFAGNTLIVDRGLADFEMLAVVGLLNSFAVDYMIRQKVTAHCNMFYVYQLPVPRLAGRDPAFLPIVERAARLICTTLEFDELAREAGLRWHEDGATDPAERAQLRAELDGMIAHLYGLTEDEYAYILTTFPLVDQAVKDAALGAYRALTPPAGDPEIIALIARGESPTLEFKESVFWDDKGGKQGEKACWKTVAAFLNTDGGDLLIGVHDEGQITGLEPDYARLHKRPDRDGWQQAVTQFLINTVSEPMMSHVRVTIHQIDGKDVCRVRVKPSTDAVWVKEGNNETLYVRISNSTRPLTGSKATDWVRNHWS